MTLSISAAVLALLANPALAACPSTGVCTIMPLGDSITDGYNVPGGYRVRLAQHFAANGDQVDFVGALRNGPGILTDKDHEGHSGWRIEQVDDIVVTRRMLAYQPDVVLVHLGTNDVYQGYDLPNAPSRLSELVGHILALGPDTTVLLAAIIPVTAPAYEVRVQEFNAAIPGIVDGWVAAGYDVRFVDQHTGFSTWMLADGVHPNQGGYAVMGDVWYAALASVLP